MEDMRTNLLCLRGGTGKEICLRCVGVTMLTTARFGTQGTSAPFEIMPSHSLRCHNPTPWMRTNYNLEDLLKFQEWASQRSTQLPDTAPGSGIGVSPLLESVAPSATPNETPRALSQRHYPHQATLTFIQEAECDPD
jgi:hypothetical protein